MCLILSFELFLLMQILSQYDVKFAGGFDVLLILLQLLFC